MLITATTTKATWPQKPHSQGQSDQETEPLRSTPKLKQAVKNKNKKQQQQQQLNNYVDNVGFVHLIKP